MLPNLWRAARRSSPEPLGVLAFGGVFALGALARAEGGLIGAAAVALAGSVAALGMRHVRERASHPLRTAASVLDALRQGDYTHRARTGAARGSVLELLGEINRLAEHLHAERLRAEETSALLEVLVERLDVALLAFDADARLRWWNPAANALFSNRLKANASAGELGAAELFEGQRQRSITLPGSNATSSWELWRGSFHQAGLRYQFVLLAPAQRVRREEERAAWQRLVRVIGHEVNNTLAPIQSLAGTLRGMLEEQRERALPEAAPALSVIEHRAAGLARFVGELSRLARLPEPRFERIELGAHVRRVAALDTRCAVHVLGQQHVELEADGALLEQAVLNLIRNAVDASLSTGGAVRVDWHADDERATLTIVDEGPGIENPDNLFVPLFSTKPGGSGIGLVLARNIVEAHGGELGLEPRRRGPGAVARLTLPRGTRRPSGSRPDPGARTLTAEPKAPASG